jgi:hypothetical protein
LGHHLSVIAPKKTLRAGAGGIPPADPDKGGVRRIEMFQQSLKPAIGSQPGWTVDRSTQ